jgi:hypothetical protein
MKDGFAPNMNQKIADRLAKQAEASGSKTR